MKQKLLAIPRNEVEQKLFEIIIGGFANFI